MAPKRITSLKGQQAAPVGWWFTGWTMCGQVCPVIPLLPEVVVDGADNLDCVVLRLRGRLSIRSKKRVCEYIAKSLVNTGRVLIDLSGLYCSQTSLLTVFLTALAAGGGWPSARLVLFGADPALCSALAGLRIPETVPLAADVASARALLDRRPPQVRRHRDLPLHFSAAAGARMLACEACAAWSVPHDVGKMAEMVASELVSNAVLHAHTPSRLTLTYTAAALRVAVRDYCRCRAVIRPRPVAIGTLRGRGLHLVATLAQSWCVDWCPDGKTVWANLAIDPPD
jgi:anti-sigma regulatory factor (Ser/Thr protein kinase)/anti-anti-sigma regulatory factor